MKKRLLLSLLIHLFCIWVLLTMDQLLPYLYRVHIYGNFLWKPDHSALTTWEYFLLLYDEKSNAWHFFSILLLYIPLVELSYWYIVKTHPLSKAIIASFVIGITATLTTLFPWDPIAFGSFPFAPLYALLAFSAYAFIYGVTRKYFYERANIRALQLQRVENELNVLKAQLRPHFFFNSLNYLYGTALKENAGRTAAAISIMSDMMRYTISGTKENFVPITEELKFIENYLVLQRVRLPEKESISIEHSIIAGTGQQQIAPLLLLPFIENAFKYGISIDHACFIKIRIEIHDNRLMMEVYNRIITEHAEVKGNNTGISNTRKRLELLYAGKYSLQCDEAGALYKVSLLLQLN